MACLNRVDAKRRFENGRVGHQVRRLALVRTHTGVLRALRGERGLLLLGREGHDGSFAPLWSCSPPGGCRELASFRVERQGRGSATSYQVDLASGAGPIEIRSARLLYRDAPLEDLGFLGRLISPFTGSPVTYVYRAAARIGAEAPVDGVLEVELSGE